MRSRTPTCGPMRDGRPTNDLSACPSPCIAAVNVKSPHRYARLDCACLRDGGESSNDSSGCSEVRFPLEDPYPAGDALVEVRNYAAVHDRSKVDGGENGQDGADGEPGKAGQHGILVTINQTGEDGQDGQGVTVIGSVTIIGANRSYDSDGPTGSVTASSMGSNYASVTDASTISSPSTRAAPSTITPLTTPPVVDSAPSVPPQPPRSSAPTSTPQDIATSSSAASQSPTIASTDTLSFHAESSGGSIGVSGSVSTSASLSDAPSASSSSATATTPESPATATVTTRTSSGHGPSSVLIIALSSVLAVCALVALALGYFLWRKHRRRRTERGGEDAAASSVHSKAEYDESGPGKEDGKLLDPSGTSDPDTARVLSPSTEAGSTLHITADELSSTAADVGGMRLSASAADLGHDAKRGGPDELRPAAMPWERRRMDVGELGGQSEGVREVEYEDEPPPYEPRARWP